MNKLMMNGILILSLYGCSTVDIPLTSSSSGTDNKMQINDLWDKSYGGSDKSYDLKLLQLRDEIAPKFKVLQFQDEVTGKTMAYNLYIPENYDSNKKYPLVLFMADASTVGKVTEAPLKQGYGGIIWATPEHQAKNPSFVLVPSYNGPENVTNDQSEVTDEADVTLRLLEQVISEYSIDRNRLYTTGQSMGGMLSFYFNATHPDLFAASLFVGSQWDVNVLQPLTKMKFFYIVSEADPKASVGMKQLGDMLDQNGASYASTKFSARLPKEEQNKYITDLIAQEHDINFVQFTVGTVIPQGSQSRGGEHMYSFDYAYQLDGVRDWLFQQVKEH